jgi:hypothetical protein
VTSRAVPVFQILRVAAGSALVTGAAQVLISAYLHLMRRGFIWIGREYVWMTPWLLALFGALGLGLAVIAVAFPRAIGPWVTGFIYGTLGALSLILLIPGLHHLAALALPWARERASPHWLTQPRRTSRALGRVAVMLAVLLGGVGAGRWALRVRADGAATVTAPRAAAPNVLIIILDAVGRHRCRSRVCPGDDATQQGWERRAWCSSPHSPPRPGLSPRMPGCSGPVPEQLSTDWQDPLDAAAPAAEVCRATGTSRRLRGESLLPRAMSPGSCRGSSITTITVSRPAGAPQRPSPTRASSGLCCITTAGAAPEALLRMDLRLESMWTSHRKRPRR